MQVAINITDSFYDRLVNMDSDTCCSFNESALVESVKNGTPLPDGAEILTKAAYSDLCTRAADVSDTNDGDLISRQAVLEVLIKYAEHMGATKYWQMRDDIRALPLSSRRKPGIWTHENTGVWTCGVCGEEVGEMGDEYGVPKYNFCPYCGADMTGRRLRNDR